GDIATERRRKPRGGRRPDRVSAESSELWPRPRGNRGVTTRSAEFPSRGRSDRAQQVGQGRPQAGQGVPGAVGGLAAAAGEARRDNGKRRIPAPFLCSFGGPPGSRPFSKQKMEVFLCPEPSFPCAT